MFDFIVGHINYWACIILMMIGLYVVVSRGNLVKTVIGLSLFQTSVILLYITMANVADGTAPIYVDGHGGGHGAHGEAHGDDHSGDHGDSHDAHDAHDGAEDDHGAAAKIDNTLADHAEAARVAEGAAGHHEPDPPGEPPTSGLHDGDKALNTQSLKTAAKDAAALHAKDSLHDEVGHGAQDAHGDHPDEAVDDGTIYSNPLPHVLMLTAIVVGVATTAVGLALAVRIREAYGTIEEDEIQIADDAVEFGRRDGPQDAIA